MITVAILINGHPILARSAVNTQVQEMKGDTPTGRIVYDVDDGSKLLHDPDNGAVALAKMLLDTIKEQN